MERKKVLVVDDDPIALYLLQTRFNRMGIVYYSVLNSHDALDFLSHERVDLIILDHILPDIKGLALCKKIKKNPLTQDIPILFFTCHQVYHFPIDCERAGAEEVIYKGDLFYLIDRCREILHLYPVSRN